MARIRRNLLRFIIDHRFLNRIFSNSSKFRAAVIAEACSVIRERLFEEHKNSAKEERIVF